MDGGGELSPTKTLADVRVALNRRLLVLWGLLEKYELLKDAHGVHDMAVEIVGIEIALKELK